GYVYPTQICNSIPLYGAAQASAADHWYTTILTEHNELVALAGWADLGIIAYNFAPAFVYPSQMCGSAPLYVVSLASATDHYYITILGERDDMVDNLGWVDEGIAAYVLP
ncbi:hypothetical protein GALMADRAFT_44695, partial [Galerina marginata CBS 339.88]